MFPNSDDDESTRDSSMRSINLLQESPLAPPAPLQQKHQSRVGGEDPGSLLLNTSHKLSSYDNNNSSPSAASAPANEEESSVVSPATQTINELSETNQNTSLHYNMSQLEQDVAKQKTFFAGTLSSKPADGRAAKTTTATASTKKGSAVVGTTCQAVAAAAAPNQNETEKASSIASRSKMQQQHASKKNSATDNTATPLLLEPFLNIGDTSNFSLYKIEITSAGTLGLKITRARPPDDLVQSLEHYNATSCTSYSNKKSDKNNDDDATVDEATEEGLQNACFVELVREPSLAASFGIEANDWFVQVMTRDGTASHDDNDALVGANETKNRQCSSTPGNNDMISFLLYSDVRAMARQTQRPITFLVARRNNTSNSNINDSNTNTKTNQAASMAPPLRTRPKNSGATVPQLQQQQRPRELPHLTGHNSSPVIGTDGGGGLGRTRRAIVVENGPSKIVATGLRERRQNDQDNQGNTPAQTSTLLQAGPALERPRQETEKSANEPPQQQARQTASNKEAIDPSKMIATSITKYDYQSNGGKKHAPAKKQAPTAVRGSAKGTQPDVNTDDHVPFCSKCNSAGKSRVTIHHAWCPKHGQFHNSGADVILERLRMGIRCGCPTCTKEMESGRLFPNARHTQTCMKNQERLKSSSSNALAKKQESLDKQKKKKASSTFGKRKSSCSVRAQTSSSMSRKKKKQAYDFSDTSSNSSGSSEDERQKMRRGRKTSTATTTRRRRSTARLSDSFSEDDSDESMYVADAHGKRRRPMQTLLALKKQKRWKESGRAERASHITPNETTRVGQAQSLHNRNASKITKDGKRRISSRSRFDFDEDDYDHVHDDNDDDMDGSEPIISVWEIDDNPWGHEGHVDGDVILYAPQIDLGSCDMLLPSNRYKSNPFSANSQYLKTHQTPTEGFQLLVLRRDNMARCSWGFSCYLHEFGGGCLVKHVDPLSPADTASFAGLSPSTDAELGLRPNDMIIAVNGKLTGGMGEVELQVTLETAVCELLLVVSRYKFVRQGMDKVEEAERSLLAAVDEAMNDEHLLDWTDLGPRVSAESTTQASGSAKLPAPSRDGSLQDILDGNGNASGIELAQPSKNVGKVPPGNGQEDTLKNATGVSAGGKSSNVDTDTRIAEPTGNSPDTRLLAASSLSGGMERLDEASTCARTSNSSVLCNGASCECSAASRHDVDRLSPLTAMGTENRAVGLEQNSGKAKSDTSCDEKSPVAFEPIVATRAGYASSSNMLDRFSEPSQEISSRGSHGSADDEDDDGNAWCGCVCGLVHPKSVPVYWIQCGACMTWYNVARACVGFDCHYAETLEHWECWACKDPDASVAQAIEQECTEHNRGAPSESLALLREQTETEEAEEQQTTEVGRSEEQQNCISSDRTSHESATGPLEDCRMNAAVDINPQAKGRSDCASTGNCIPPDRWTADGCIIPKSKPSQRPDGTYIRTTGRGIDGFRWDEIRGVYEPIKQTTCTSIDARQTKGTTGKQRGDGVRSRKNSKSSAPQRRLRPVRHAATKSATTTSSPPPAAASQNPGEQGISDNNNTSSTSLDDDEVLNEGDHVMISEHAWPGVDNPEGFAVVLKSYIDEDGDQLYDVKYIVGGRKTGILARFVSRYVF